MNFGRYPTNTYGEVLRTHPEFAESSLKENKRDNRKARFAHWAMAFIMETFFGRDKEKEEEILEEEEAQMEEGGDRPRYRRTTSAERARSKEEDGDPDTDSDGVSVSREVSPSGAGDQLSIRLLTGDWDAVDQMCEELEGSRKIALAIVDRMKRLQEKTTIGRTDEELEQDREAFRLANSQIKTLGDRTYYRNKLRKSGMALQLFKTMCEVRELGREAALRGVEEPEGEIEGKKDKSDGLWRFSSLGV